MLLNILQAIVDEPYLLVDEAYKNVVELLVEMPGKAFDQIMYTPE